MPRRPATAARLGDVRREEAALDPAVLRRAVRNAERLDLRGHDPDAKRLDFAEALRAYPSLPKGREYVLVCELGLKSAHLAERMREEGLRARHFRGGTRALRRWCEARAVRT